MQIVAMYEAGKRNFLDTTERIGMVGFIVRIEGVVLS